MTTRNSSSTMTDILFDAFTDAAEQLINAIQNNERAQEIARLSLVFDINSKALQQEMAKARRMLKNSVDATLVCR